MEQDKLSAIHLLAHCLLPRSPDEETVNAQILPLLDSFKDARALSNHLEVGRGRGSINASAALLC
ncbi:hypothetical protein IE81DRAFT_324991 [Ceraceosorus guamensis]|uniref:Uncharacterized protein n=1 Tax=Ceraceosorus guamensis TaxID=1522189 RepID=A0A316VUR4_9BASI|nr:hypothetical protein IE81DRAFT_324991 [Ceraceosorus guamensis]PWN40994.1 hypothetical protein IE81DRAFT_324991 [Ceraceosorus guamensis]